MNHRTKRIRAELLPLIILGVGIFAFRSSFADHYYVPSGSMEHTLLSGDRVVVNKAAYGVRVPFTRLEIFERGRVVPGDVAIFDSPRDGTRLIKRIVGVGGDTISISGGHLSINGIAAATGISDVEVIGSKFVSLNLADGGGPDVMSMKIPHGMLLAVGDHRGNSRDGRYFGLIAEAAVYGKAVGIYRRREEGFVWRSL